MGAPAVPVLRGWASARSTQGLESSGGAACRVAGTPEGPSGRLPIIPAVALRAQPGAGLLTGFSTGNLARCPSPAFPCRLPTGSPALPFSFPQSRVQMTKSTYRCFLRHPFACISGRAWSWAMSSLRDVWHQGRGGGDRGQDWGPRTGPGRASVSQHRPASLQNCLGTRTGSQVTAGCLSFWGKKKE